MRCEKCYGTGYSSDIPEDQDPFMYLPCEECGGTGVAHCCDGIREQESTPC